MNPAQELSKIQSITEAGTFEYCGVTYLLDADQTAKHPANKNLDGRPIRKLVGTSLKGNTVMVWSHDCATSDFVIDKAVPPVYEVTETYPDLEPTVTHPVAGLDDIQEVTDYKPKRRKKKSSE